MASRRLLIAFALASVAYVALVATRHAGHLTLGGLGLGTVAMGLAWWSARAPSRPLAWAGWGTAITLVALIEPSFSVHVAAVIGAIASSAAAIAALPRAVSLGGIVRDRPRSHRLRAALLAVVWLPAVIATARSAAEDVWMQDGVLACAAGLSGLVVIGTAVAGRFERRLELGVVERLQAFLLLVPAVVGVCAALLIDGSTDATSTLCAACALLGLAACATATLGDPVLLWRAVRRYESLGALATVFGAAFEFLVIDQRGHERLLIALLALGGILAGAELSRVTAWLRRPNRRLLAIADASRALRGRDADLAIASALRALQVATPPPKEAERTPSPELWMLDAGASASVARVDTAGYMQETAGELPPELVMIAVQEPEGTLRAEALDAVQIRRPDLRALARWMSDARMASATLVARGGEVEGVLLLPTSEDAPDLSLEEARALRQLADELAPICHARAQLARSMKREREAREEADDAMTKAERFEHQLARASAQHALATGRLARPAAVGIYSASSRDAYDSLEKLARAHAPAAIVAPSGVDPVPFVARAHLAGARGHAPLVLVDGTSSREHDLERWRDPVASPLALADGGVLLLLDVAALPLDVQRLVGQALAERRAPWARADALDIVLAATTTTEPRALAEGGRLDALLASRLGSAIDEPIRLPRIRERAEDIRALVTDRLAREGLRVRGTPVGIEDAAFAALVDHPFDGEDAELAAVVQRLVARLPASAEVVREADIRAVLGEAAESEGGAQTRPVVVSRRP